MVRRFLTRRSTTRSRPDGSRRRAQRRYRAWIFTSDLRRPDRLSASVLDACMCPVESQMLVMSKTGIQALYQSHESARHLLQRRGDGRLHSRRRFSSSQYRIPGRASSSTRSSRSRSQRAAGSSIELPELSQRRQCPLRAWDAVPQRLHDTGWSRLGGRTISRIAWRSPIDGADGKVRDRHASGPRHMAGISPTHSTAAPTSRLTAISSRSWSSAIRSG